MPYEKDGSSLASRIESLKSAHQVLVAERSEQVVGVIGLYLTEWNFRPSVGNLRVDPAPRRSSVGQGRVAAVIDAARKLETHGLWLEVTNVNTAAIPLYRKAGFRLCGFDEAMYTRWGLRRETALFFVDEF